MDDLTLDWVRKQQAIGEKVSQYDAFEKFNAAEMPGWSDKDLAGWQAIFPPDSPQFLLGEHEWRRRLADRQIAAAHATARRAAIWGAASGIIGAVAGALLTWFLSGPHTPPIHQRSDIPVQAQGEASNQPAQQQPVSTPPQPAAQTTLAPVQKPVNPDP